MGIDKRSVCRIIRLCSVGATGQRRYFSFIEVGGSQDRIREGGRVPVFGANGIRADSIFISDRGGAASAARLRPSLSAEFRSVSSHLLASFPEYCGILASFLLGECAKAIGLRAFAEVSACESGVRFGSLF